MIPEPHATPSNAPHFNALGVVFGAWNVSEGALPGAARTVWVSSCGRIRCGSRVVPTARGPDAQWASEGPKQTVRMAYWCRLDGTLIETDAGSLLQAMKAGAMRIARPDAEQAA